MYALEALWRRVQEEIHAANAFSPRDLKIDGNDIMQELYEHWLEGEKRYIEETRRFSEELTEILKTERDFSIHDTDGAWDVTSVRKEARQDTD